MKHGLGIRLKLLVFYWVVFIAGLWGAGFLALREGGRYPWSYFMGILLVSTGILFWGITRFLVRPIREILEAMGKFTEG